MIRVLICYLLLVVVGFSCSSPEEQVEIEVVKEPLPVEEKKMELDNFVPEENFRWPEEGVFSFFPNGIESTIHVYDSAFVLIDSIGVSSGYPEWLTSVVIGAKGDYLLVSNIGYRPHPSFKYKEYESSFYVEKGGFMGWVRRHGEPGGKVPLYATSKLEQVIDSVDAQRGFLMNLTADYKKVEVFLTVDSISGWVDKVDFCGIPWTECCDGST